MFKKYYIMVDETMLKWWFGICKSIRVVNSLRVFKMVDGYMTHAGTIFIISGWNARKVKKEYDKIKKNANYMVL